MTTTRRGFLRSLLAGAAAVATAPLAALAPAPPIPLFTEFVPVGPVGDIRGQIMFMANMQVRSPRMSKMIYGITE